MAGRDADPVRSALGALRRLLAGPDFPAPAPPAGRRWARLLGHLRRLVLFGLLGLTFAAAEYLEDSREFPEAPAIALGVGSTLPPAMALRWPLWAWRLGYPMLYLGTVDTRADEPWPWNPVQIIGYLLVLVVLASRAEPGVTAWAGLLTLPPAYLFVTHTANAHGVTVLIVVTLIVGDQVRRRRQSQLALVEQAERSEREQARRAVLEERTRIARELHDVVAHHMSMIAVQAETAPYRLAELPEPARAEFTAIADSARGALVDMRRLLGVLRSEAAAPQTAPQPGLDDLAELVAGARRAGMTVRLVTPAPAADDPAPPAAVGLAAYRIVQEAMANAARHAPGAAVRIALERGATELTVRVENAHPTGRAPAPGTGSTRPAGSLRPAEAAPEGHGLTGMRERVRLLDGTLRAGPTDGGYAVVATLPYHGVTAGAADAPKPGPPRVDRPEPGRPPTTQPKDDR